MKPISLQGWITIALAALSLCGSGAWALYGAISSHVEDVAGIRSQVKADGARLDSLAADMTIIKTAIIGKGLADASTPGRH